MVYFTDRSKAMVPVLVLLFVALWFILRGDLFYVLTLCHFVLVFFGPFSIEDTIGNDLNIVKEWYLKCHGDLRSFGTAKWLAEYSWNNKKRHSSERMSIYYHGLDGAFIC